MTTGFGGTRITLDHIEKAAQWAIRAREAGKAIKVGTVTREFDMGVYDRVSPECGTACCILGAAALMAGHSGRRLRNSVLVHTYATLAADAAHFALGGAHYVLARACDGDNPEATAPEDVLAAIAAIRKAGKGRGT